MSRRVSVYLDDRTEAWLLHAGAEAERSIEDLAESLVSEGALAHAKASNIYAYTAYKYYPRKRAE